MSQPQQFGANRQGQPPAPFPQHPPAVAADSRLTFSAQLWELPDRRTVMFLSLGIAVVWIIALTVIFPKNSTGAEILIDHSRFSHFPYPFTIQNLEHLIFFVGLGELFVRWRVATREHGFIAMRLLPEDQQTVLQPADLAPIRRRVAPLCDNEHGFLPSLIDISILQFQSGRSIDQVVSIMNSSLELIEHRVDMRYGLIRYIAWLIPTVGFIGTVIGLGGSLAMVPKNGNLSIYAVAHALSLGFNCTMVALMESAILVFVLYLAQEKEETALNLAGTYTLRNLINRLYEAPK
ncbi:MAG TPA: MotA/TolQ/ExbB proton channel family protein [Candidatus Binataceae bacterium]|nr:MotA/TolQ/ExbB proton channel family protein [Candidatus Binataceae bacterium]HVB82905.1 MotA/TolQ/ExbB proton channel family protein [Candidatus Binataceae bacterium]